MLGTNAERLQLVLGGSAPTLLPGSERVDEERGCHSFGRTRVDVAGNRTEGPRAEVEQSGRSRARRRDSTISAEAISRNADDSPLVGDDARAEQGLPNVSVRQRQVARTDQAQAPTRPPLPAALARTRRRRRSGSSSGPSGSRRAATTPARRDGSGPDGTDTQRSRRFRNSAAFAQRRRSNTSLAHEPFMLSEELLRRCRDDFGRGCLLEESTSDDLGEVAAGRHGLRCPLRCSRSSRSRRTFSPGIGQGDVVLVGRDHHDDDCDIRDVVGYVEQRPEEGHVVDDRLVRAVGEVAFWTQSMISSMRTSTGYPPPESLRHGVLVAALAMLVPLLVIGVEQPPQEPLPKRLRGPSRTGSPRLESCCRRRGPRTRAAQIGRDAPPERSSSASANTSLPRSVEANAAGVRGQVPQTDQPVGLAAAHRLVEPPQGLGALVYRVAPAQPDRDLRHEADQLARRVSDLAVVRRPPSTDGRSRSPATPCTALKSDIWTSSIRPEASTTSSRRRIASHQGVSAISVSSSKSARLSSRAVVLVRPPRSSCLDVPRRRRPPLIDLARATSNVSPSGSASGSRAERSLKVAHRYGSSLRPAASKHFGDAPRPTCPAVASASATSMTEDVRSQSRLTVGARRRDARPCPASSTIRSMSCSSRSNARRCHRASDAGATCRP